MTVEGQKAKRARKGRDQVVLRRGWAPSSGKVSPLMKEAYAAEWERRIAEGFVLATPEDARKLRELCLEEGRRVRKQAASEHQRAVAAKKQAEHKARCDAAWEARDKARREEKRAKREAKRAAENKPELPST